MAELVDACDSKSYILTGVGVRFPPEVQEKPLHVRRREGALCIVGVSRWRILLRSQSNRVKLLEKSTNKTGDDSDDNQHSNQVQEARLDDKQGR